LICFLGGSLKDEDLNFSFNGCVPKINNQNFNSANSNSQTAHSFNLKQGINCWAAPKEEKFWEKGLGGIYWDALWSD